MANILKAPQPNTIPLSTDVGQFALLFQGLLDAGQLNLAAPQNTPTTPTTSDSGISGNPNGAYRHKVVFVTGWVQSDNTYYVNGFAPSASSTQLTVTSHKITVSLPIGGSGTIARAIYRTAAGGASGTEQFIGIVWDNTTTTYTDNIADVIRGTGMPTVNGTAIPANVPTANTTGTYLGTTYFGGQIVSTVAPGTSPFSVTSTTTVSNLSVEMLNNYHYTDFILKSIFTAVGDILYGTGSGTVGTLSKGAAYQHLGMNSGATAPQWQDSLQSIIQAVGDLIVGGGSNTPQRLVMGSALQYLRVNSGATGLEWVYSGVATGNYAGDGNSNRTINVGFTPKFMLVVCNDSNSYVSNGFGMTGNPFNIFITNSVNGFGTSNSNLFRPEITTNGFIVSANGTNTSLNRSGFTYYWVAMT